MITPGIWWAPDPEDGRLHAVATCDVQVAAERGWTEALCGSRLPIDVGLCSDREDAPVCWPCHIGVVPDLRDSEAAP